MANNTTLPGTGDVVRDIDKDGVKTQVMAIDIGGAGIEVLADANHPMPVADSAVGNFLWRILQMLMAPLGFDKSLQRQRSTAIIESGTVTTVTTVTGLTNINGFNGDMLIRGQVNAAWALNVRARIT